MTATFNTRPVLGHVSEQQVNVERCRKQFGRERTVAFAKRHAVRERKDGSPLHTRVRQLPGLQPPHIGQSARDRSARDQRNDVRRRRSNVDQ